METLFGISMNSIMVVMLVLLGLCLLLVAFVAWRRPVIFKLGVRNIPRRKTQTALIIVGLMLATLIISAALATGDTMNNSVNSAVYDLLGPVDELVVASFDESGEGSIDAHDHGHAPGGERRRRCARSLQTRRSMPSVARC